MSAACHYLKDFDRRFPMTYIRPIDTQRQQEIDAEHERDEDRAIYGMMVLIAGLGMAILIGIAVIGAWAQ
jgi:hypothetical protein